MTMIASTQRKTHDNPKKMGAITPNDATIEYQ